jgi:hypothetical protein
MTAEPDTLLALCVLVGSSMVVVAIAVARLLRSGRPVPPPWTPPEDPPPRAVRLRHGPRSPRRLFGRGVTP